MARSNDKKRARLNIISHLLASVPYKALKRDKVKLPKRKIDSSYRQPDFSKNFIPELY